MQKLKEVEEYEIEQKSRKKEEEEMTEKKDLKNVGRASKYR